MRLTSAGVVEVLVQELKHNVLARRDPTHRLRYFSFFKTRNQKEGIHR